MKKVKLLIILLSISILFLLTFLSCGGADYLENTSDKGITFTEVTSTETGTDESKEFDDFYFGGPIMGDPIMGDPIIGDLLIGDPIIGDGLIEGGLVEGGLLGEDLIGEGLIGDMFSGGALMDGFYGLDGQDAPPEDPPPDETLTPDKARKKRDELCETIGGCDKTGHSSPFECDGGFCVTYTGDKYDGSTEVHIYVVARICL